METAIKASTHECMASHVIMATSGKIGITFFSKYSHKAYHDGSVFEMLGKLPPLSQSSSIGEALLSQIIWFDDRYILQYDKNANFMNYFRCRGIPLKYMFRKRFRRDGI